MAKRWSKAEIAHLKRHAKKQSVEELAQRFHVATDAVRRKLEELGLGATEAGSDAADAAIGDFSKALELVHGHKWQQAAKLLEKVIAETEEVRISDRARQYLEICRLRLDKDKTQDSDPYLHAVFEKNRGNLEGALKLCKKHGAADKEERYAYLMASIRALSGAEDEALELLKTAIRLDPKNRVHAYHDPDFEALQGRDEFAQLIQAP